MEQDRTAQLRWTLLICAVTALAAALRLYELSRYSIWYDEGMSLFSILFVDWKLTFLRADEMRLIPLYPVILFFWHGFVGNLPGVVMGSELSDFLLRLLPLFFGVLTIPLTFVVGRHLTGDPKAGLIAALLVAVSPFHVYYGQELRPHSLYVLMVLAAQYYMFRALEENRWRLWAAGVAYSVLSFYAYYHSVFFLLSINLYVLLLIGVYRMRLKPWIVSQLCVGLGLLPALLLALFTFRQYTKAEEHWVPQPTLKTVGITFKNFFAGYSPEPWVYWPLFALGGAACLAGVLALRSKPRVVAFLLVMSLGTLLIEVVFWNLQEFSFYTYRAQIAYSPVVFILAGAGIAWMRPRWLRWTALIVILGFTAPALSDLYAQRLHHWEHRIGARYKVDSRSAAAYIKERLQEDDFIAHAAIMTLVPFRFHYLDVLQSSVAFTNEERQWHLKGVPDEKSWHTTGNFPFRIEEVSNPANRVWYVLSGWELDDLYQTAYEYRAWYDTHAIRVDRREFDGLTVFLYDMDEDLLENTRTHWVADFGNREVPRYDFSATKLDKEIQLTWREGFESSFPPKPSSEAPGLDVWFEDGAAREPDGFPALDGLGIRLANRSTLSHQVSLQAYEAEEVVNSLAFDRDLDSDVWRPVHSHGGKIAFRGRVNEELPTGRLMKTFSLASGRYDLYVQMFQGGFDDDPGLSDLQVYTAELDGPQINVGHLRGNVPGIETGWRWLRAGEIESRGVPFRLELTTTLGDGLSYAEVNVHRLMFVKAVAQNETSPTPYWSEDLELQPRSEQGVVLDAQPEERRGREVYVEILDAAHDVFRTLSFEGGDAQ